MPELHSLDPERNPVAVEVVSGVFVEEMLHLALAANLLNAAPTSRSASTAPRRPYQELQHVHDGLGISAQRVGELCIHPAFCISQARPIAKMLDDTADSDVRSNIMGRIDHCPSGSYSYALERGGETIEADLPRAISVLEEDGMPLGRPRPGGTRRHRGTARLADADSGKHLPGAPRRPRNRP